MVTFFNSGLATRCPFLVVFCIVYLCLLYFRVWWYYVLSDKFWNFWWIFDDLLHTYSVKDRFISQIWVLIKILCICLCSEFLCTLKSVILVWGFIFVVVSFLCSYAASSLQGALLGPTRTKGVQEHGISSILFYLPILYSCRLLKRSCSLNFELNRKLYFFVVEAFVVRLWITKPCFCVLTFCFSSF